ncbi:ABC transporter permease [Halostella litorea]|uniref:ABC transporter permease n=1 Tax=Halostella litorea TaxID=2528831 RepID=UPI0010923B18|nr:ABC transporter permease [Halostella litorea]
MSLSPASVRAVARKDFRDALRSKTLWILSALFVLFAAGMAYIYTLLQQGTGGELSSLDLVFFLQSPVALLVPLTALLLGYKSIAGEIDSGSVKILLSLPHSRSSVVLGKLLGRTAVLTVPILIGFAVAAVVVVALYATFSPGYYVAFVALTVLFGLAYVSIAVAVSATTKSTSRAAVGIFGVFALFNFLWDVFGWGLHYVVTRLTEGRGVFYPFPNPPNWYFFFQRLSPNGAFSGSMTAMLPGDSQVTEYFPQGDVPFYLQDWFSLLILVAWIVVPLSLCYRRFKAADI